ncbi:FHA domain-containing protein FhaB/FipA [Cellulomonas chengniuliangii]|uniref:FHA domain-containing protein n=1 Tax=Cellulomonas chengniuliangii TaxID=2968084 RepID=A0ABY5KXY6_9CELL|nr:FHA domain-containing protein [Cellulomonas chengniuliangii]MCC2307867.1 FHA domain-containing protein [Cellulomonas chengniuliangii]MCC2318389.1 FHA domain-containing protein [Cellulomonas chengniuliangii]UUI75380.1 FHA domain-containing protein [Cellulomonas chengniuliangii]
MSELTVTLLRVGYLVLLWVFVLSAISVLRRDLYGTKIVDRRVRSARQAAAPASGNGEAPRVVVGGGRQSRTPAGPTRLVVTEGPLRGTTLPLGTSAVLIGRAPSCTLVLDDDYSSSRHARIFPQADQWWVEDLGSTNGTFLGDQRVDQPTPVPPGMQVRVGQSVLELQR